MRKYLLSLLMLTMLICLASCGEQTEESGNMKDYNCDIFATEYDNINSTDNPNAYISGASTNLAVKDGIIVSPYYTMKINGIDVPVYATRTTNTIHSFAYIDVDVKDKALDFSLDVELTINKDTTSVFEEKS